MKFSTRDRYALRLMVELANRPNDLIPLKDISDKQRISLKYLEQIVTPLAKAGLVSSGRCPRCRRNRKAVSNRKRAEPLRSSLCSTTSPRCEEASRGLRPRKKAPHAVG